MFCGRKNSRGGEGGGVCEAGGHVFTAAYRHPKAFTIFVVDFVTLRERSVILRRRFSGWVISRLFRIFSVHVLSFSLSPPLFLSFFVFFSCLFRTDRESSDSTRCDSIRPDPTRSGAIRLDSTRFDPIRLDPTRIDSTRFGPIRPAIRRHFRSFFPFSSFLTSRYPILIYLFFFFGMRSSCGCGECSRRSPDR